MIPCYGASPVAPSWLLSSSRRRAHASDDRGDRVGSQGPRHCGHLSDPRRAEHIEQTMWLNDALHPGTGLRCSMSMGVMQMQHSLETITPPTRQCGSPHATKLGSKASGVTHAYSLRFEHTGHCHCSSSDHVISPGPGSSVHEAQVTGSFERIS